MPQQRLAIQVDLGNLLDFGHIGRVGPFACIADHAAKTTKTQNHTTVGGWVRDRVFNFGLVSNQIWTSLGLALVQRVFTRPGFRCACAGRASAAALRNSETFAIVDFVFALRVEKPC